MDITEMISLWQVWASAGLLLVVIEVMTVSFASLSFAVGAFASAICAAITPSIEAQVIVFCIVTVLCFCYMRPFMLKITNKKANEVKTNAHALIGRQGKVDETITRDGGRVIIDGDNWKAISADGSEIQKGTIVEVTDINSIILTVKPKIKDEQ